MQIKLDASHHNWWRSNLNISSGEKITNYTGFLQVREFDWWGKIQEVVETSGEEKWKFLSYSLKLKIFIISIG